MEATMTGKTIPTLTKEHHDKLQAMRLEWIKQAREAGLDANEVWEFGVPDWLANAGRKKRFILEEAKSAN
jgi:hypothetical protein